MACLLTCLIGLVRRCVYVLGRRIRHEGCRTRTRLCGQPLCAGHDGHSVSPLSLAQRRAWALCVGALLVVMLPSVVRVWQGGGGGEGKEARGETLSPMLRSARGSIIAMRCVVWL